MMCASTVQVAALPGEVVSNTGKQNRKVLAAPVMKAFASVAGATTLLRQKHGNRPRKGSAGGDSWTGEQRSKESNAKISEGVDSSHACAAEMVRYREERNYEP